MQYLITKVYGFLTLTLLYWKPSYTIVVKFCASQVKLLCPDVRRSYTFSVTCFSRAIADGSNVNAKVNTVLYHWFSHPRAWKCLKVMDTLCMDIYSQLHHYIFPSATSQINCVHSDLHLVTYLHCCSQFRQLFYVMTMKSNLQVLLAWLDLNVLHTGKILPAFYLPPFCPLTWGWI